MLYKRINVGQVVTANEAEAVESELKEALDQLEEKHTPFGGNIESVAFEHLGNRRNQRSHMRWTQPGRPLQL